MVKGCTKFLQSFISAIFYLFIYLFFYLCPTDSPWLSENDVLDEKCFSTEHMGGEGQSFTTVVVWIIVSCMPSILLAKVVPNKSIKFMQGKIVQKKKNSMHSEQP